MRRCIDCGKKICSKTKYRCWNCYKKFIKIKENTSNWQGGKSNIKISKCIDCGKITLGKYCQKCYLTKHNPSFKGLNRKKWGRKLQGGYWYILNHEHLFTNKRDYISEQRLVMEEFLRKNDPKSSYLIEVKGILYLNPKYVIHHKNRIRTDNRIENLEIKTKSQHMKDHHKSNKTKEQMRQERRDYGKRYYKENKEKELLRKRKYNKLHKKENRLRQIRYLAIPKNRERKRKWEREYKRRKRQEGDKNYMARNTDR